MAKNPEIISLVTLPTQCVCPPDQCELQRLIESDISPDEKLREAIQHMFCPQRALILNSLRTPAAAK